MLRALLERDHDPAAEDAARICLGYALMASGRPQDGLAELERATSSPLLTGTERSGALGWASIARMWLGDLDGCEATAEEAGAAAGKSGDHMTTTIASSMSAIVSLYHGQLGRAAELIDGAVRALPGVSITGFGLRGVAFADAASDGVRTGCEVARRAAAATAADGRLAVLTLD